MFLLKIKKTNLKHYSKKILLLSSALILSIASNSYVSSQVFPPANFNEDYKKKNKSFITKAVEKTGASVVTIDTQRLIKKNQYPRDSRKLIDPYFEKFFGLELPYENPPRIEQSQGIGFIFADGLVMTNAHVID